MKPSSNRLSLASLLLAGILPLWKLCVFSAILLPAFGLLDFSALSDSSLPFLRVLSLLLPLTVYTSSEEYLIQKTPFFFLLFNSATHTSSLWSVNLRVILHQRTSVMLSEFCMFLVGFPIPPSHPCALPHRNVYLEPPIRPFIWVHLRYL